jgi:uncharacterized SAM-binding protein YcdF (DUF218 family)
MAAMRWNRFARTLGIGLIVVLLISAFTPLWNRAGRAVAPAADIGSAEAIIVLASGMAGEMTLDDESLRRTAEGVRLYQQGLAPLIVFSGGVTVNDTLSESEIRAKFARDVGIPAEAILLEKTANTTREESVRVAELLSLRGARRVLLVTESLHMNRGKRLFERAGFQVFPAPSDDYSRVLHTPLNRLWLMMRVLEESVALVYYRLAGYV